MFAKSSVATPSIKLGSSVLGSLKYNQGEKSHRNDHQFSNGSYFNNLIQYDKNVTLEFS